MITIADSQCANAHICSWLSTSNGGARLMTIVAHHPTHSAMPLILHRLPRHTSSPQSLTASLVRQSLRLYYIAPHADLKSP